MNYSHIVNATGVDQGFESADFDDQQGNWQTMPQEEVDEYSDGSYSFNLRYGQKRPEDKATSEMEYDFVT